MKFIIIVSLICAFSSINIFAVCEDEPTIANSGKILKEIKIEKQGDANKGNPTAGEISLTVKANVIGASWQKSNAEAAVLTVFVDGKYNQDAILFAGEKTFEYQMLLGKFDAGEHKITLVLNEKHSAPKAREVKIYSAFAAPFDDSKSQTIVDYQAKINAPIIYLRPDTIDKFSDVPLLTYYEIFDEPQNVKRIHYTTIFTNEDGGTQSAALMARWGRMTDIEWIYELRVDASGAILSEIYQAANHETKNFQGARFGSHPLISDATVNNNFADTGCTALRVSPLLVQANLSNGSRETVMDANAWTYQIMAQEAFREGRVNPAKLSANTIADPRDYLYAEIYSEPENAAIAFELKTSVGKTASSDAGDNLLRVGRPGYVRIALRLPADFIESQKLAASVRCYSVSADREASCRNVRLIKIIRLDREFRPRVTKIEAAPQTFKANEAVEFSISRF